MSSSLNPREVIERALTALPPGEQAQFAEELMTYAAAAMVFSLGNREATERAYRVADRLAVLK